MTYLTTGETFSSATPQLRHSPNTMITPAQIFQLRREAIDINQTRRRLGGRQPLCGIGVTSRMLRTSMPVVARARIADSRPEPGPETRTSTERTPWSRAALAAPTAACCAANGVPLREPRKPSEPDDFQLSVLPIWSVMVTMVLLNEA